MRSLKGYLFLLGCLLFLSCSPPIKNLNSTGSAIICFGDSVTQGQGVQIQDSFPSVLSQILGREVINAGISGDTTFDALNRIEEDVLERDPYLVIIELGGNDFLRRFNPADTFSNLEKIIELIQEHGAMVALCDISSGPILGAYKARFKALANKKKAIFIPDCLQGILDNPDFKVDDLHPNVEAHKLIAQRIYKELQKYPIF